MDMDHLHSETIGIVGGYDQEKGARYNSFTPPLFQTVTFPLESAETARIRLNTSAMKSISRTFSTVRPINHGKRPAGEPFNCSS